MLSLVLLPISCSLFRIVILQLAPEGIAPFENALFGHAIFRAPKQPIRIAAIAPLIREIGPGPKRKLDVHQINQAEQILQVAAWIGVPVEVEDALFRLLSIPEGIKINGVDAQGLQVQ